MTSCLIIPSECVLKSKYYVGPKINLKHHNKWHLSQKCNIIDVDKWFDMKNSRIVLPFYFEEKIKLEFKKYTNHDFPDEIPCYAKQIFNCEDMEELKVKIYVDSTNEIKNIFYNAVENAWKTHDFLQEIKRDNETEETCLKILEYLKNMCINLDNGNNYNCYYLYASSYQMHILDNKNFTHLLLKTHLNEKITITIEKTSTKMVSICITNIFDSSILLYNFYNEFQDLLKYCDEKLDYYMNCDEDVLFVELDDVEEEFIGENPVNQNDHMMGYMGTKLMNIQHKKQCEIRKKMRIYEHLCLDIIIRKNNLCIIEHDMYRKRKNMNKTTIFKQIDIELNLDMSVILKNQNKKTTIKHKTSQKILYDLNVNLCDKRGKLNISLINDYIIIPIFLDDSHDSFALYSHACGVLLIYNYKPEKITGILKQKFVNFTDVIANCDLIKTLNIGKLDISLDIESNYFNRRNFLKIDMNANKKKSILVQFSNELDETQILVFNANNNICNSRFVITEHYVYNTQIEKNINDLTIFYGEYINKFFGKILNANDNSQYNMIKKRLKKYTDTQYMFVRNLDVLHIYAGTIEYELYNDPDYNDYNNFKYKTTKQKIDKSAIDEQLLFNAIGKKNHVDITNVCLDFLSKLGNNCEHKYDIKLDKLKYDSMLKIKNSDTLNLYVLNKNLYVYVDNTTVLLETNTNIYKEDEQYEQLLLTSILNDDNFAYSIDEFNIGYITENLIFVRYYDRFNKDFVTIHNLNLLNDVQKKEFDVMQSHHFLTPNTEFGKFYFEKETGLNKEHIYHMNLYMIEHDLVLQDSHNFVIVCGFGNIANWASGLFGSTNNVKHTKSNNGKNSNVYHNNKEVFRKENGVIIKNDMKIGILAQQDYPKIVWKVAHIKDTSLLHKMGLTENKYCILKLYLPDDTIFIRPYDTNNWNGHLYAGKSRCNKAVVLAIQEYRFDQEIDLPSGTKAISSHSGDNAKITYHVGDIVFPDEFDMSNEECSHGIHVFEERHHIVSLTGDAEVKPVDIIRKIMPKENEIIQLANLKTYQNESKIEIEKHDVAEIEKKPKKKIIPININEIEVVPTETDPLLEKKPTKKIISATNDEIELVPTETDPLLKKNN